MPEGTVMTVSFRLQGQAFVALKGGPHYAFAPAISFAVDCESQAEIDALWDALSAGGEQQRCGWVKDRCGVSWQIMPAILPALLGDADPVRAQRVMTAMLAMRKLDIGRLRAAYEGDGA